MDALGKKPYDLIEFPRIRKELALAHLKSRYTSTHDSTAIERTWDACAGDFRACTAALDFGGGEANVKDTVCDGLDAMRKLLFDTLDLQEAIRLHDGDSQMLTMGLFENYCHTLPSIEQCTSIADAFASANVVDERVYGRQEFELMEFFAALSAGVPALKLPKPAIATFEIQKVGTIWSRGNNQRSKEKTMREITFDMLECGLHAQSVTDVALLRCALKNLAHRGCYTEMRELTGLLQDTTVLNIMRLFKTKYTQADHAKFKKARLPV